MDGIAGTMNHLNLYLQVRRTKMEKQVYNVYRNTHFTKRNYDCTNIAACIPVDDEAKVPEGYEVAPAEILQKMQPLWIDGGIQFWGWL